MLSKWDDTFSLSENMEKTAYELGKAWGRLWRVGSCTAALALSCPLTQSLGVVNGGLQVLGLLHLTAATQDVAKWWL